MDWRDSFEKTGGEGVRDGFLSSLLKEGEAFGGSGEDESIINFKEISDDNLAWFWRPLAKRFLGGEVPESEFSRLVRRGGKRVPRMFCKGEDGVS